MKRFIVNVMMLGLLSLHCGNVQAQGFLSKLAKKAASSATQTETTQASSTENATSASSIKWESVPYFVAKKVYVTNEDGSPMLNEDGTQAYRVFLIDTVTGMKRSKESVKAQQAAINKAILLILAKVGGGALVGGLANGGSGAAVGAATGAVASVPDIAMAKKQKKSLKQQKKLLEAYSKIFDEEGKPISATIDPQKIPDLDLKDNNESEMASAIKAELESEGFNSTDTSAWEI